MQSLSHRPSRFHFRGYLIVRRHRRTRAKLALIAVVVVALATGGELWRMHSANAITYDTVPVEPGTILASVPSSIPLKP